MQAGAFISLRFHRDDGKFNNDPVALLHNSAAFADLLVVHGKGFFAVQFSDNLGDVIPVKRISVSGFETMFVKIAL